MLFLLLSFCVDHLFGFSIYLFIFFFFFGIFSLLLFLIFFFFFFFGFFLCLHGDVEKEAALGGSLMQRTI